MPPAVQLATPTPAPAAAPQSFARAQDRARLTPPALAAVRNLAQHWGLSNAQAAALIGVSPSTWDRIKRGTWRQPLAQDQLTRASALIGIYKGLHLLFADAMADRWPGLPNSGPVFAGRSPVDAMIEGGIPAMLDTRLYVDAVRGGL